MCCLTAARSQSTRRRGLRAAPFTERAALSPPPSPPGSRLETIWPRLSIVRNDTSRARLSTRFRWAAARACSITSGYTERMRPVAVTPDRLDLEPLLRLVADGG